MSWQFSNGSRPPHHGSQTGHDLGSQGLTLRYLPNLGTGKEHLFHSVWGEKKVGLDSCRAPGPGVRVRFPHVAAHQRSPLRLDLEMAADPVSILRNHPYLIGKMGCCDSVSRRCPATRWSRSSSAGAAASSKHSHVTSYLMELEATQACTRRTELTLISSTGFSLSMGKMGGLRGRTALRTTRWLCSPHPAQTKTCIFEPNDSLPNLPAAPRPPTPVLLSRRPLPPSALGPPRAQAVSPPRAPDFPLSSSLSPEASQVGFWWDEA